MKKKILKYILVGILLYITVIVIEISCISAVQGDNIWNWLTDFWNWYKSLLM